MDKIIEHFGVGIIYTVVGTIVIGLFYSVLEAVTSF